MPQLSYDIPIAVLGQLATYDPENIDSLIVLVPNQQTDVVTGGTAADGVYSITVVGEEGTFVAAFDRQSAEDDAAITDALAAAWLALGSAVLNIATMTSDGVDTNQLDFLNAGNGYTVTSVAPSTGTLVSTLIVDPDGSNIPLGIGISTTDGEFARLLTTGDLVTDIWGIVVRNSELVQDFNQSVPTVLEFLPADSLSVMRSGEAWVAPEVAVVVNDPVFIRVVATGAEQAGALSNVVDGTDNVLVPGRWKTSAAAGELAKVLINLP